MGIEHEVVTGLSVGVTGIWRKNDQFIDDVLQTPLSEFATVTAAEIPDPTACSERRTTASATVTMYDQLTDPTENQFLITNPEDAERRYQRHRVHGDEADGQRWQMQGSWVISKIDGNYNNTSNAGQQHTEYNDPNTDARFQPFREGRLTNDNTHIAKMLGTVPGPLRHCGVRCVYFTYPVKRSPARFAPRASLKGRSEMFIEPRGSQRYDSQTAIDFKLEKQFRVSDADGRSA